MEVGRAKGEANGDLEGWEFLWEDIGSETGFLAIADGAGVGLAIINCLVLGRGQEIWSGNMCFDTGVTWIYQLVLEEAADISLATENSGC